MTRKSQLIRVVLLYMAFVAVLETAFFLQFRREPPPPGQLSPLSANEALHYISSTDNVLIIDVRTQKEFNGTHVPGAVNIPLYAIPESLAGLPHDRPIVIHCIYGVRALQAYKLIRRLRPDIKDMHYVTGQIFPMSTAGKRP